jgi:hypothetical protein
MRSLGDGATRRTYLVFLLWRLDNELYHTIFALPCVLCLVAYVLHEMQSLAQTLIVLTKASHSSTRMLNDLSPRSKSGPWDQSP